MRAKTAAIALALGVAIAGLDATMPSSHLAYVGIVPVVILARASGVRAAVAIGILGAFTLALLEHRLTLGGSWRAIVSQGLVLAIYFTIVLVAIERYDELLRRSHRAESLRVAAEHAERIVALASAASAARERDLAAFAEAIPQLVWRADGGGAMDTFNEAWFAYTGGDVARGPRAFWNALAPEDVAGVRVRIAAALEAGTAYEIELRLRRADGVYRWFVARSAPLRDANGAIVCWFGTCTDIDDQKIQQANLEARFAVAHRVSEAFQRASLPTRLPDVPGLTFSALYRAGKREASVGGDWYDALRLLDGRIVISIGDVAGSGLGAAITMVAMRQAMRGAAQIHADPIAILEAADRTLREDAPESMVTAFVGVFDPVTRLLTYALAGHPTPFLRLPDGNIVELAAPGLPLGVRRKGDTEAREIVLGVGSFLVLYTDGLVESTHDFVAGERRLRDAVARVGVSSTTPAADRLAALVLPNGATDDVAILALVLERDDGDDGDSRFRRFVFRSDDRAAARETHASISATLVAAGANDAQLGDADMIYSELVGNVVRHAPGLCEVVLDASGTLPVLSVLDRGRGFSHAPHLPADTFAETGRGLFIVRALALEFGATRRRDGGSHARAVLTINRPMKRRTPTPLSRIGTVAPKSQTGA